MKCEEEEEKDTTMLLSLSFVVQSCFFMQFAEEDPFIFKNI